MIDQSEWLAYTSPEPMLDYLATHASDRKLRLFACACCRRQWDLITDEAGRRAVETSERFADDQATAAELAESWSAAAREARFAEAHMSRWDVQMAVKAEVRDAARAGAGAAAHSVMADAANAGSRQAQCNLLRDIFGNPFHPVATDATWLTYNDGAVPKLAGNIYAERRFADLPKLADTLAAAGCQDENLLKHCREPGEHVRGCWVIDLLLGYE